MIPYIACTILSCLAAHMGTKVYVNGRGKRIKIINVFFFAVAIFLPCFLAAVRDQTVGTDVRLYGYNMFLSAQDTDIMTYISGHRSEPLFNIIAYIIAQFHNVYFYFFALEFLVVFPVFLTIRRYVDRQYTWMALFLYFCLLYGFSLNLMRQCITMAFVLWGSRYIFERKPLKYVAVVAICFFIHYSSVIALILYPLSILDTYSLKIENGNQNNFFYKYRSIIKFLLSSIAVIGVSVSGQIIESISGATGGRYEAFVSGITGEFEFDLIYLILIGGVLLLFWCQMEKGEKKGIVGFLFYVVFIGVIVFQARGAFSQLLRVSLYFTNYLIILLPITLPAIKKRNTRTYQLLLLVTVLIFMLFVYYYYIIKSWNGVVPYHSSYLRIN